LEIKQASIPDETNEAGKVTLPVGPQ
jgi:hypothetical protein